MTSANREEPREGESREAKPAFAFPPSLARKVTSRERRLGTRLIRNPYTRGESDYSILQESGKLCFSVNVTREHLGTGPQAADTELTQDISKGITLLHFSLSWHAISAFLFISSFKNREIKIPNELSYMKSREN